jgi:hypothetical protein
MAEPPTCLLSRPTPENIKKWGKNGTGIEQVADTICPDENTCPYYHYQKDAYVADSSTTKIHLLIASFRDRLCSRTLFNAFSRADYPERIFVRVIDQTLPDSELIDDAGCWERYCSEYNKDCQHFEKNVKILRLDSTKSKGPTDARSKLSAMIAWDYVHGHDAPDFEPVELQDFCMETDSHMDFSDGFDTKLIEMHHRTENDYAVLSTYVAPMEQNNQDPAEVPHLCMVEFTSTIRNWGTKECTNLKKPKLTNAMWGAGLSFHRCHAELNVPIDPYLDNVFDGEEGSRGIRFFTHGYDVYTPDKVLVTHDYHGHQSNPVVHSWGRARKGDNKEDDTIPVWRREIEAVRSSVKDVSTKRVNMMLGIGQDNSGEEVDKIRASRFGLGTKRTLEQACEFTGIDFVHRNQVTNKCGNLLWVPFEESDGYGVAETLARDLVTLATEDMKQRKMGGPTFPPIFRSAPLLVEKVGGAPKAGEHSSLVIWALAAFGLIFLSNITLTKYRKRSKGTRHQN